MAVALQVLRGGLSPEGDDRAEQRVCELRRECPEPAWIEVDGQSGGCAWGCPEHAAVVVAEGWGRVVDVDLDRLRPLVVEDVQALLSEGGAEPLSQGERTPDRQGGDAETVSASALSDLPAGRPAERQPEWMPTGASRDLIHLGSSEVVGPWGDER